MHWVLNFKNGKSPARVNHASASVGNYIYSFGGYCEQLSFYELKHSTPIDVYQLNTITLKWKKRPIPNNESEQFALTPYFRYGHTCVNYQDFVYLWGGRADWTNNLCNNLYKYDTKKHLWKIIEPVNEKPDGRDGHSACVIKNSMYIYGGFVQKVKKFSNDVYEFDFVQLTWTMIIPKNNVRPYWRDFHTASAIGDNMYIFGGRMDLGGTRFTGENFYLNDLYSFNTKKKQWTQLIPDKSFLTLNNNNNNNSDTTPNNNNNNNSNETRNNSNEQQTKLSPCGRRSHSAVVYNNKMIIFGGFQENIHKHFNDMYIFDPDRNEWKVLHTKGTVPSQRRRHCCVIVNDQMFIFGGTGPTPNESPNSQSPTVRDATTEDAAATAQNNVDLSYQEFMRRLENNLIYIQNATRERNNINFAELNNQFFAARLGLAAIGQQLAQIQPQLPLPPPPAQPPQNEFDHNQRLNAPRQPEQPNNSNSNNNTSNNTTNNNNNNNNQLQNNIPVIDEINDDSDFDDSDSEDLINDESDDEDRINTGLYSLSDLHILSLNVPSLKLLAKLKVLNENIKYSNLPNDLINELTEMNEWRIASK